MKLMHQRPKSGNKERNSMTLYDKELIDVLKRLDCACGTCHGSGNQPTVEGVRSSLPCKTCGGKGRVPTEVGDVLLAFLERHQKK